MDILKPSIQAAIMASVMTGTLLITACSDDNMPRKVSYQIEVTNLTAAQPMSPLAVAIHPSSYEMWQIGASASDGLEQMAEGGDNSLLLSEASDAYASTISGNGLIMPGASDSVIIDDYQSHQYLLSFATMLVNTNDAFTGLNDEAVRNLALGETRTIELNVYDAGTEANSESMATIPGPAAGGEGYNMARDDRDTVGGHPGVVSSADGLSSSVLNEEHRFDNPVAIVTITRLK